MKNNGKYNYLILCLLWIFLSSKLEWTIPGMKFIAPVVTLLPLILFLLWLLYDYKKLDNPITCYFLLFLILMTLSSALARNNGIPRFTILGIFLLYLTYLATITFANNERRIYSLFNIFILGNLFIAILGIKGGGRVPGVALYGDQNDFALIMNIVLPIALFLGIEEKKKAKKLFYFISFGIFLTSIILSNSRGGFLALIIVLFFAWLKLPRSKLKATFIMVVIALGMVLLAPKSFWLEMSTLKLGTQESTASNRIIYWKIAVRQFLDHPIIGVGVINYGVWLPDYASSQEIVSGGSRIPGHVRTWGEVCHSIYFTLLAELGIVGIILFSLMVCQFYKEIRLEPKMTDLLLSSKEKRGEINIKRNSYFESIKKCHNLCLGLHCGMIGFLASGAFLSVLYYQHFWLMCAMSVTLGNFKRNIIEEAESYMKNFAITNES